LNWLLALIRMQLVDGIGLPKVLIPAALHLAVEPPIIWSAGLLV